jgi:hypothetical protein
MQQWQSSEKRRGCEKQHFAFAPWEIVATPETAMSDRQRTWPAGLFARIRNSNFGLKTFTVLTCAIVFWAHTVYGQPPAEDVARGDARPPGQAVSNVTAQATNAIVKAATNVATNVIARVATNLSAAKAGSTNVTTKAATNVIAQARPATNATAQADSVTNAASKKADNVIPMISLNGVTYSNVVIESATMTTITFAHSRGVASVNPDKLTMGELRALGLAEPEPPPTTNVFAKLPAAFGALTNRAEIEKALDRDRLKRAVTEPGGLEAYFKETGLSWKATAGVTLGIYLFLCFCLHKICRKVGRPSPLVWIPFFQIFVIYRAAKMPPVWFALLVLDVCVRLIIVFFVPMEDISKLPQFVVWGGIGWMILFTLIHVIGWIIWCFKICVVRGKSPAWGLFLLLPCTQVFVIMYLAFSK